MSEIDDLALLHAWRAGDKSAGEALFERYFASISRFFETKCEPEADELVQATFFACLNAKNQFRSDSSFRTYLFTIARHELYRVLRTRKRDGEINLELSSIAELVPTPGTILDRNAEKIRLIEGLRRLSVSDQTLLELHYWEDMTVAELAEVFEAQQPAIRQRLVRARKALRDVMQELTAGTPELESLETMDVWVRGMAPENK